MDNALLFDTIDAHLIDLRQLSNEDPRWLQLHHGKIVRAAWCFALPKQFWNRLKPWERDIARVYIHARTAHKAVLIGKPAALIHGIPTISRPTDYPAVLPSGSVPQQSKGHFFAYKAARLHGQTTTVHGIKLTSLERTAIDMARLHGFEEGLVAADYVRAQVGRRRMQDTLGALGRVKGVATARAVVAAAVVDSESPWESYARALLLRAGINVRTQYIVGKYRADLAIDGWLLIEIDGDVKYQDKPVEAIRAEHRRQKELLNMGYVVLRFSPEELRARPEEFVATVRRMLAMGPRRAA